MNPLQLNPNFDFEEFLTDYWQQKPLYIPQLIPGFTDPLSPEELAGLAMEADCESRLLEGTDPKSWTLSQGPFPEERFTALPEDGWTLLVQAVDQWNEEVYELKQLFEFIPQWRIEDVMVSFAANGAGVGPHFDFYDVFLVQGSGERHWQLGPKYTSHSKQSNCAGLSILDEFCKEFEYTLRPGDALYIPPQYGHWGKSIKRSLCYSIGFRAPSSAEILEGYSDLLIDSCRPEDRYKDPSPHLPSQRGEIEEKSIEPSFERLLQLVENKANYFRWFGESATRPKYPTGITPLSEPLDALGLLDEIAAGATIAVNPGSRVSFLTLKSENETFLFVDGETIILNKTKAWQAKSICSSPEIASNELLKMSQDPEALKLLLTLLNQGSLISY
ncbi:MAG: cupin domain-containing protein [Pseudohongiellaceae bacterium]